MVPSGTRGSSRKASTSEASSLRAASSAADGASSTNTMLGPAAFFGDDDDEKSDRDGVKFGTADVAEVYGTDLEAKAASCVGAGEGAGVGAGTGAEAGAGAGVDPPAGTGRSFFEYEKVVDASDSISCTVRGELSGLLLFMLLENVADGFAEAAI